MDRNKLHEAVCKIKEAAVILREEYNEALSKKSDWYDFWLDRLNKGEVTFEWFDNNVWEPYQSFDLHISADGYISAMESVVNNIEYANRKLTEQRKKIDELLEAAKKGV